MSFTVMHRKNGKIIPIKMSIWDAFAGVPDPKPKKPKSVNCPCCGKVHQAKAQAKKDDKKNDSKSSGNENGGGGNYSKHEAETYSKEDDKMIIKLKKDNKPWKEILKAIGKNSESQLRTHYKDNLKDKVEGSNKDGEEQTAKDGKGDKKNGKASDQKGGKQGGKSNEKPGENLKAWAEGYDKKKWMAVASKHYDMTGQRITAEMARKLAGGT